MTVRILHGDCREVLKTLPAASVDSIVTDPPYHLTNKGGGPHNKTPNAYSRAQAGAGSGGFMGMAWDGGDVAHDVAMWGECLHDAIARDCAAAARRVGAWLATQGRNA